MDEHEQDYDFDVFYNLYRDKFPEEVQKSLDQFNDLRAWYYGFFRKWMEDAVAHLWDLMMKQYPEFKNLDHPIYLKFIGETNAGAAAGLSALMGGLLKDYKANVEPRKKYEKFETWKEYYLNPSKVLEVDDNERSPFKHKAEEEWLKYKESENKKLKLLHEWNQKRRTEYYELMQPLIFKHIPELNEIEGDYWILFAVAIRDNYEEWKGQCDHLQVALDYELPPECLEWEYKKFSAAISERLKDYYAKAEGKRERRMDVGSK